MTVTIRQSTLEDWPVIKDVRLRALQTDPGVFGSNYAREAAWNDGDWRDWAAHPDIGVFILREGGAPIGMTAISIDKYDPSKRHAILWGSWLDPTYRGRGLSHMMYEARLDWAQAHPTCDQIVVSHRASNVKSKRANQKHGFIYTHTEDQTWPDGVTEDRVFYTLAVKPPAS